MSRDRVSELLRELPIPSSAQARERAIAAGRHEIQGRASASETRPAGLRRRVALAIVAGLVGVSLLTPPGQAAIDRVGALVGIGEVGGDPTREPPVEQSNAPVVVDNGRAPDGTRYEWVAFRGKNTRHRDLPRDLGFCLDFVYPPQEAGGSCSTERLPPGELITSWGVRYVGSKTGARRDVMITLVTTAAVHRVRLLYRDAGGRRHDVHVDFARIDGRLLARAGGDRPFGVLAGFVTAEDAARAGFPKHVGEIVTELPRSRAVKPPKGYPKACLDNRPPRAAPFELIFYDSKGRQLERLDTVMVRRASRACQRAHERYMRRLERKRAKRVP